MNSRQLLFALSLAASSLAYTQPASAQIGVDCGQFGGFGYGGYLGVGDLYRVLSQNVPHFAAFPPVYYSAPVPRTYGYSPFAYLPHVQTPEIVAPVEPAVVENPYFQQSETAPAAAENSLNDQTTLQRKVRPLEVVNPFISENVDAFPVLHAAR